MKAKNILETVGRTPLVEISKRLNGTAAKFYAVEPDASPLIPKGVSGSHRLQGIGAKEGILCGMTSGAAMWAALGLAKRPGFEGKTIVALLPDTGERYLSTWLFED